MKVTRIAYSENLNASKYEQLAEQARRLGRVRGEVWQRYGSVNGVGLSDRKIRDAVKAGIRHAVIWRTSDPAERQRLFTALKRDTWTEDPFLARQMRQHWKRGRNRTHNQIVVRSDQCRAFTLAESGDVWLAVPGLQRRQLVRAAGDRKIKNARRARLRSVAEKARKNGDVNRRLAAWTKGVTAEALTSVSERRGSVLTLVNAAYTSQVVPCCGALGRRGGERLHCTRCGAVWQADHAAAINVLHRVGDPDITPRTPYQRVRRIVRERTDRRPDQTADPGLQPTLRAESETSERSTLINK